ncbi:nicotinate-nucleotide adenylyltransferase [Spirochaetia bacterium]|nr:nicotinate-nucleotide adenylyltransferase [Spirochaetia bacterium]
MMRFAILGGSFDPVHNGHIHLARSALTLGYDRVIFVPAFHSPFKPAEQGGSADVRLQMLLSVICAQREFTVDPCEIKREGLSYTVDTLNDIILRYVPEGKPALILGDDLAGNFDKWKDAGKIASMADIIIAGRTKPLLRNFKYPFTHLDNDIMELSSGAVRRLIKDGKAWKDLVPETAKRIIEQNGLYAGGGVDKDDATVLASSSFVFDQVGNKTTWSGGASPPIIYEIETKVRMTLNSYRFIHSRNVALHCYDLCRRFNFDADKGYIAGITHDFCKGLTGEQMIECAKKDGLGFTREEIDQPKLLHGRAAAIMLGEVFGIEDEEIIEAVRYHTTGKRGMCALSKLVYLCDKIEAGRTTVDRNLRILAFTNSGCSADGLFNCVFKATVEWLLERKLSISDETLAMLDEMENCR